MGAKKCVYNTLNININIALFSTKSVILTTYQFYELLITAGIEIQADFLVRHCINAYMQIFVVGCFTGSWQPLAS